GAQRAEADVVPHEAEPVLPGRAEQVHHQGVVDRDAAEVHGDGGRRLAGDVARVVDADRRAGHRRLGAQRFDLGDRADEGRLANAEAAGDDELDRCDARSGALGSGLHGAEPRWSRSRSGRPGDQMALTRSIILVSMESSISAGEVWWTSSGP